MSKNNVNNDIKELKPSTDVVTCTMTNDEHEARVKGIREAQANGRTLEWYVMTQLVSAKERHEQTLDSYDDSEKGFNNWVMDNFEIGETQVKQAVRLIRVYGDLDLNNNEWSINPKFTLFGKEKLDIIQRHKDFKTKGDFDAITKALDITPYTSRETIRQLINQANGKAIETKSGTPSETKEERQAKKDVKEIKETDTYKELEHNFTDTKTFIAKWFSYANDKKMSDKDFREKFIDAVKELEKTSK